MAIYDNGDDQNYLCCDDLCQNSDTVTGTFYDQGNMWHGQGHKEGRTDFDNMFVEVEDDDKE